MGIGYYINININFYIAHTPTVRPKAHYMVISLYHVLFGAVCTIEEERFQSSAKSNC